MPSLGVVFPPSFPPEALAAAARAAESAGVAELWLWEDCFREGGLTTAVLALEATTRLTVGVGVLPMPLRNVAITAMELATIDRVHPGRLRVGVGHGVLEWMAQVGARVASPLTLMREYVPALRGLLAGDEVTVDGRYVRLDRVRLDWPPANPLPILCAAGGPKTLTTSGAVADGSVLTGGTSIAMLDAAVARIREGSTGAGRTDAHDVVLYLLTGFGADDLDAEFDLLGWQGEQRFAAVGDPDRVAGAVREAFAHGATTVVLQPRTHEPDLAAFMSAAGEASRLLTVDF